VCQPPSTGHIHISPEKSVSQKESNKEEEEEKENNNLVDSISCPPRWVDGQLSTSERGKKKRKRKYFSFIFDSIFFNVINISIIMCCRVCARDFKGMNIYYT
jgi:hypothetical protein